MHSLPCIFMLKRGKRFSVRKLWKVKLLKVKNKMTTFIKTKFKMESPSNFQVNEEKNYSNRSINKEIWYLWSESDLRESTISDLESPSNFQVKEKKLLKSVQKQRKYALIKNAKIVMFKMEIRTFMYFTRYLTATDCHPWWKIIR